MITKCVHAYVRMGVSVSLRGKRLIQLFPLVIGMLEQIGRRSGQPPDAYMYAMYAFSGPPNHTKGRHDHDHHRRPGRRVDR